MSIRVMSGAARGRWLRATPEGYEVRPILNRIRKSLFDILRPRIREALFLDLYAGTGAVGIEALSEGARKVVFVDENPSSIKMVEKNVQALNFSDRAEILLGDATKSLVWLAREKFDIIFLGPPYKDAQKKPLTLSAKTLNRIVEAGLLKPGGMVVAQRFIKEPLEGLDPRWDRYRENKYGDSVLSFFRLKEASL
ncbi:MAG TPA: 16S rRNA (guanine(966)-N(2))-methyltransferase RsmD [Elusimicrobiota bacterium]|nr:16S rRNA (guanine(966)-N(2))-methyltransferase RsmD [Elusimicrobiota bacterium]